MKKQSRTIIKPHVSLSAKQQKFVERLFAGDDEMDIIAGLEVSPETLRKWLEQEDFKDALNDRIEAARRKSQIIIARYAPAAAERLVNLTESEKEETARKACLDIIAFPDLFDSGKSRKDADSSDDAGQPVSNISDSTAARILKLIAEDKHEEEES